MGCSSVGRRGTARHGWGRGESRNTRMSGSIKNDLRCLSEPLRRQQTRGRGRCGAEELPSPWTAWVLGVSSVALHMGWGQMQAEGLGWEGRTGRRWLVEAPRVG